jgi:phospholipid/cholesterol/gamma-HCH transport system ATP-binding protein
MNSVVNISDKIMFVFKGQKEWEGDKRTILRSGNENVDKFVFVSDLIRRDLYDEGVTGGKPKVETVNPVEPPVVAETPPPGKEESFSPEN